VKLNLNFSFSTFDGMTKGQLTISRPDVPLSIGLPRLNPWDVFVRKSVVVWSSMENSPDSIELLVGKVGKFGQMFPVFPVSLFMLVLFD
jgi:hypothetical protein